MTKQVREEMKKMDKEELRLAIADGIRLAVKEFLHETWTDFNKKKDGAFKWIGRTVFWILLTAALSGLVNIVIRWKLWQKLADAIIGNLGN